MDGVSVVLAGPTPDHIGLECNGGSSAFSLTSMMKVHLPFFYSLLSMK